MLEPPSADCPSQPPAFGLVRVSPWAAGVFGIFVVGVTFVEAIYRLGVRAHTTLHGELDARETWLLGASVALFAYAEGYRALHGRFVPHVVARAAQLSAAPQSLRGWLIAPLYVLCLVQAHRSSQRRAWLSVILIVLAVLIVRALPEPWRGIIDAGVAAALSIGLASLVFATAAWLRGGKFSLGEQ
ncbi:MAG TPA: hypothetical protein VJV78_26060 [Polyangiales bacterium]|nr:hypothetical protein [Polyangiales bacterium]